MQTAYEKYGVPQSFFFKKKKNILIKIILLKVIYLHIDVTIELVNAILN